MTRTTRRFNWRVLLKGITRFAVGFASKALQTYWKVFKPQTFGVKALILHPSDPERCLLVRHSYSDQQRWGLPGGGYRPRKESAEKAIRRECMEELRLEFAPSADVLEELVTELEGKRDHLTIFRVTALSAQPRPNREIEEARWTALDFADLPPERAISRWANLAISAHRESGTHQTPDN
jgi:8-oxo-dGTP diphosphatase